MFSPRSHMLCPIFLSFLLMLSPGTGATGRHDALNRYPVINEGMNFTLQPPSNLFILPLDSSFHVTWTPSPDPATVWHLVSVWDGSTLLSSKIVGKTGTAAQTNGLRPGQSYTVKVQAMDGAGHLSPAISGEATTDPQTPMPDAAFFENFNEMPGDLDANYFDIRTSQGTGLQPESIGPEKMLVFNNERHFHTQLIGGKQRAELMIRPRVPFDFSNRIGTFQFEVDLAPVQHSQGKWFEIHLVKNIPWSSEMFGAGDGENFPDSIEFSVRQGDGENGGTFINIPQITVNTGGNVQVFEGTTSQMTPANIRVPVMLKVGQDSAEFIINGISVVTAHGFHLPFSTGYWVIAQRGWYASRDTVTTPVILQLIHWETIQFDGPAGSYNPVVRTYIQPGCRGEVNYIHDAIEGCPNLDFSDQIHMHTITLNIADPPAVARSARLLYNGNTDQGQALDVSINGHHMAVATQQCCNQQYPYEFQQSTSVFPAGWLQQGANQLLVTYSGKGGARISQVEIEVVYDQPRVVDNPPIDPMPMLLVTSQSFRIQRSPGDPMVLTATTYLYSAGSAEPVNYTASLISTETPWIGVTPANGLIQPPVFNGQLVPLTIALNFTGVTTDSDGEVGVIKISGGNMPLYIAVLAINDGSTEQPTFLAAFPGLMTNFNKRAIPGYSRLDYHLYDPLTLLAGASGW